MTPACRLFAAIGLAALAAATPAMAEVCRLPDTIRPAPRLAPPDNEISRTEADHHLLSMSWSPEWCRQHRSGQADRLQCRDNRFGFVLHGLWPSAARGAHPRYCAAAPSLDAATVRRHLCMTPSTELLQHEWAAHGTCGWSSAAAYFDQAAALWNALQKPDLTRASMTAGEVRDAFIAANPGLAREALFVRVTSGNRLQEVGVCYDLNFRVAACPRGLGTPDTITIRITPRR
jgi:ribonuclease T2